MLGVLHGEQPGCAGGLDDDGGGSGGVATVGMGCGMVEGVLVRFLNENGGHVGEEAGRKGRVRRARGRQAEII
jgi:hypothetical protein